MIPREVAQRMMHLDQAEIVDEMDPTKVIGIEPARATMILVKAKDGITEIDLRSSVEE